MADGDTKTADAATTTTQTADAATTATQTADAGADKTTILGAKTEGDKTAADTKTEGAVKTEGDKSKTEAPAIDPAKLTLPEGFTADEPTLRAATDILSDASLSPQDRMQKLVDFHASELKKQAEASTKYWSDQQKTWQDEAKKTYGPEPAKSPKIIAASKLIDSLGEKPASDLKAALDMSGMGNHPAVIGALVAFAERLTEGTTVVATKPTAAKPTSFGDALYGPQQNSGA